MFVDFAFLAKRVLQMIHFITYKSLFYYNFKKDIYKFNYIFFYYSNKNWFPFIAYQITGINVFFSLHCFIPTINI